jgi:hypothetical protein
MSIIKYFAILILLFGLFQTAVAEKRAQPKPMSELTNPASPSYVPMPYPKTREEIIDDLKYAIKITTAQEEGYIVGKIPEFEKKLLTLLDENPECKIGQIFKVKNRHSVYSHDYSWLILVEDKGGRNIIYIGMHANGLFAGAGDIFPHRERALVRTDQEILDIISEPIGHPIKMIDVKHIERVAFASPLGDILTPLWEINMKNGVVYYFSLSGDNVYEAKEKRDWKKQKNGFRKNWQEMVSVNEEFLPDEIDDKLIILEKHERKKK